jgi:hypothetical protein
VTVTPDPPSVVPPAAPGQPPVVVGPNPPKVVTVKTPGKPAQTYRVFRNRYYPIVRGNG